MNFGGKLAHNDANIRYRFGQPAGSGTLTDGSGNTWKWKTIDKALEPRAGEKFGFG